MLIPLGIISSGNVGWLASLSKATTWEAGNSITVDSVGNVYIVGRSEESNLGIQTVKYDLDGNVLWQRRLDGTSDDEGWGIAVDSSGNVYIAAIVGNQGHIAKYNSSGVIQWQTRISASSQLKDLKVDSSGNVYVVGLAVPSSIQAFIAKYDTNGIRQWAKLLDSSDSSYFESVALDSSGNVYATGITNAPGSDENFVIAKYSNSGTLLWQRSLGGSTARVFGEAIAVDSSGDVYVVGTVAETLQSIVIAKYNTSGTLQWQRQLGFSSGTSTIARGVTVDYSDNIYIVGITGESGVSQFSIAKYNSAGTLQWQRRLGSGASVGQGISSDLESVYVTGYASGFGSRDFLSAKLPNDGSAIGTYNLGGVSFTYTTASATDSAASLTSSTASFTDTTATNTDSSTALTDSASTLTANVVAI
jgi:uncharacterized delta-60 repeat protein